MKHPLIPSDELQRLETLEHYRVLDTSPEPEFDALTELASSLFGAPIALVSLVDRDRQWFKSKYGIDVPETAREISFCGHAILETDVFIVEDARKDDRFCDNPLVKDDPSIRFYAGAPLRAENGQAIGTLCVIDREPRVCDASKIQALRTLARLVMTQLELRKKNHELETALQTIDHQREEIIHHSKMSALGEMAGGMAHEINNPLAIISGYSSRIAMLLENDETEERNARILTSLDGIGNGIDRITSIIRGLRLFSRDGANDPLESCDLRQVIRDSLGLCQEQFRTLAIQVRYVDPAGDVLVACRPTQISQILVNLLNNAKDSIRDMESPKWIEILLEKKGEGYRLSVSDSGPGVSPELQYRIFEPFFSTKAPGRGTGLGLSISRSLAISNRAELGLIREGSRSLFTLDFLEGTGTP
jgi:two-component system NtrC family sensor kinase